VCPEILEILRIDAIRYQSVSSLRFRTLT